MSKIGHDALRREVSKYLALQYFGTPAPDLEDIIGEAFYHATFNLKNQELYFDKRTEIQDALYSEIGRRKNQEELLTSGSLIEYLLHTFENYHLKFGFVQSFVNGTLQEILILNLLFDDQPIPVDEEKCECPVDPYFTSLWSKNEIKLPPDFSREDMTREEYDQIQEQVSRYLIEQGYEHVGNIFFPFLQENKSQLEDL